MKLHRDSVLVISLVLTCLLQIHCTLGAGCRHLRNEQEQDRSHDRSSKILCLRTRLQTGNGC